MTASPAPWLFRLPRAARRAALPAALALIALASSIQTGDGRGGFSSSWMLNMAHLPLYALLALALALQLRPRPRLPLWAWLAILTAVAGIGVVDEWHQQTVAGRSSSLVDLGSDLLGAALALLVLGHGARAPWKTQEGRNVLALSCASAVLWGLAATLAPTLPLPILTP